MVEEGRHGIPRYELCSELDSGRWLRSTYGHIVEVLEEEDDDEPDYDGDTDIDNDESVAGHSEGPLERVIEAAPVLHARVVGAAHGSAVANPTKPLKAKAEGEADLSSDRALQVALVPAVKTEAVSVDASPA
jgi:hypothetical protein